MLRRFSLYGFLKNQRYFEPFLILALREKGLSFLMIGLLVGFRECVVNLLEIPSGAVADVWGRRRSMMLSFAAYIGSFVAFGVALGGDAASPADARVVGLLFGGMFLFAVGDAFRTGTHKAMIFSWLKSEGRLDERTRVYGYTRSWSKIGSAVSVVVSAAIVLASGSYVWIFYFCILPYVIGLVNFLGYPKELEGEAGAEASPGAVLAHLREALGYAFRRPRLRRVILESMGFEGVFKPAKDYLQPVLKSLAAVVVVAVAVKLGLLAAPPEGAEATEVATGLTKAQEAAFVVGPVYLCLHLLSAFASRRAHRLVGRCGNGEPGEERAARVLWLVYLVVFASLAAAAWYEGGAGLAGTILAFVVLYVVQNYWRPLAVCRVDRHSLERHRATVLSIESQAKAVAAMVIAPALGLAVDLATKHELGGRFWPVGVLGAAVALVFVATGPRARVGAPTEDERKAPAPGGET